MLNRSLERVGPAELRVYDYEANGPVHDDGEADEEEGAGNEACIADGVWLADDAGASAICQLQLCLLRTCKDYIMLFAIFMKALRMPLRGLALSR